MARLAIPSRDDAPQAARPVLDRVHEKFGVVPAMYRLLATSPAVLSAYHALAEELGTVLDAKTRERIALIVAQFNGCDYCLSLHSYLAMNEAHICPEEIARNREGHASDPRADAALRFAIRVTDSRGRVSDEDVQAIKAAGFSDADIVGIVALVAQTFFANLMNSVAMTEIDFPLVRSANMA